ncbi:hypothetical protein GCM10010909_15990 [Acidocella aquatica]|uniref:Uncharacterized protein n=1 Tax=Acidocella aquatica TaxID=1922313 RepID=A0ABQ6A431_9PROT|nr:hypothetical protein [Acidocella aquatica]GLR66919.1 hypothetical protein GCM10010909_15990 [Acidocella aquatica]
MDTSTKCAIFQTTDGRLRLDRISGERASPVAYASPVIDRKGAITGGQLQPIVVVQGSRSKVWPDATEALASTKLLTVAALRRLIHEVCATATAGALL